MEANDVIKKLKSTDFPHSLCERLKSEILKLDFETKEDLYVSLVAEKAKPENRGVFSMLIEILGFLKKKLE